MALLRLSYHLLWVLLAISFSGMTMVDAQTSPTSQQTAEEKINATQALLKQTAVQLKSLEHQKDKLIKKRDTLLSQLEHQRYRAAKALYTQSYYNHRNIGKLYILPDITLQNLYMAKRRIEVSSQQSHDAIYHYYQTYMDTQQAIEDINMVQQSQHDLWQTSHHLLTKLKTSRESISSNLMDGIDTLNKQVQTLSDLLGTVLNIPIEQQFDTKICAAKTPDFTIPASGIIQSTTYDAGNMTSPALEIKTSPYAIVMAPADGVVIYADYFQPIDGLLIIIQHACGYISVLKNMAVLAVTSGQTIHDGDIIAQMDTPTNNSEKNTNTAMLYYELRYNGSVIDPTFIVSGF